VYDLASQVQAFVNGLNIAGDAASSHIYGADADIIVKAAPELTVLPGFSYLHARYEDFPGLDRNECPTHCGPPPARCHVRSRNSTAGRLTATEPQ
jgi:hypothetical protein